MLLAVIQENIKLFHSIKEDRSGSANMGEKTSTYLLLLIIVAVAFAYRLALMTMNTYPPGADIGLHESVIKSLTSGDTNFYWNNYHMGGGLSVTNPGFHIFVVFVAAMTGLPDYLAQGTVASFFSAFAVLCAFLIVRRLWNESAAFVVAVLAIFLGGDIVMLAWAGYPNIVTLAIIPVVFYLFLEHSRRDFKSYLIVASLVISAIFLTHIFSAFVFTAIILVTLFFSAVFSVKTQLSRRQVVNWLLPLCLGITLVSPYLLEIVPVYFSPDGAITGAVAEMKQAVLETRVMPLQIIFLSLIPVFLFFMMSRFQRGKFLTVPAILFAAWILVPAVMTQSYLFSVYLDYERFIYFFFIPMIICTGVAIAKAPNAFSCLLSKINFGRRLRFSGRLNKKWASGILIAGLTVPVLFLPLFVLPNQALGYVGFFQVMDRSQYSAIEWIKANTPSDSVFVADASFGWWLSGFAQRPTLSAVDPQYLILKHELAPAKAASNLLKADYLIDNGFIQVKQEGVYANSSTHELLAVWNTSFVPRSFFSINDSQVSVLYREKGEPRQVSLAAFAVPDTQVSSSLDSASFAIARENQFFNITKKITLYQGVGYSKISLLFQAKSASIDFDWAHLSFLARGAPIQYANSIAMVDYSIQGLTQIIFPESTLGKDVFMQENPDNYELVFNLKGRPNVEVSFFVGFSQNSQIRNDEDNLISDLIEEKSRTYLTKISDLPLTYFDYRAAIRDWKVSYVAIRDFDSIQRFTDDPLFSLVFKNDKVAVFKVDEGLNYSHKD